MAFKTKKHLPFGRLTRLWDIHSIKKSWWTCLNDQKPSAISISQTSFHALREQVFSEAWMMLRYRKTEAIPTKMAFFGCSHRKRNSNLYLVAHPIWGHLAHRETRCWPWKHHRGQLLSLTQTLTHSPIKHPRNHSLVRDLYTHLFGNLEWRCLINIHIYIYILVI